MHKKIEDTIQFIFSHDNYAAHTFKEIVEDFSFPEENTKIDKRHYTITVFDISPGNRRYLHFEFVGPRKDNGDIANWRDCEDVETDLIEEYIDEKLKDFYM